ncbi:MAG: DUF523 domain-containing protein [Thermodesulfobacteriota bacterium]|nr:MAG: DUF523 domain-containing protein [Thermodesulfobacteriota bacterium]
MEDTPVIVSACLLGIRSRHDGEDSYDERAVKAAGTRPVPVCPEQLGGLPTPRARARIHGGDGHCVLEGTALVKDEEGGDVTRAFLRGAFDVLNIARITGAKRAVLKEKSPSCGVNSIIGDADGGVVRGRGVTAALLAREGIEVKGY